MFGVKVNTSLGCAHGPWSRGPDSKVRRIPWPVVPLLIGLLATGCGANASSSLEPNQTVVAQSPTAGSTSTPSIAVTRPIGPVRRVIPAYGVSATALAENVPGCSNIIDVPVDGADVSSLARCSLLGQSVLFVDSANAEQQAALLSVYESEGQIQGYYAEGTGYDAAVDISLGDLASQRAVATVIVAALGGDVKHFVDPNAKNPLLPPGS